MNQSFDFMRRWYFLAAGESIDLLPSPGASQDGVPAVGVNYPLMGGDVSAFVPPSVAASLKAKFAG